MSYSIPFQASTSLGCIGRQYIYVISDALAINRSLIRMMCLCSCPWTTRRSWRGARRWRPRLQRSGASTRRCRIAAGHWRPSAMHARPPWRPPLSTCRRLVRLRPAPAPLGTQSAAPCRSTLLLVTKSNSAHKRSLALLAICIGVRRVVSLHGRLQSATFGDTS